MEFTLNNVYRLTYDARDEWRNILVALEMSSATINSIGMQWRDKPEDCYREGLAEWLKGDGRAWVYILEALSNPTVGYKALAQKLRPDLGIDSLDSLRPPIRAVIPSSRSKEKHKCYQWAKKHWLALLIVVAFITALVVTSIILVIVLPVTLTSGTPSPSANTTTTISSSSTIYQLNILMYGVVAIPVAFLF